MTRHLTLGALVTVALATVTLVPGSAQEERAVTIQSMDVRDNLYVIGGGGGHTAALVTGEHGVVIVDTKLAGFGQSIIDTMQIISEQPITTIINTHRAVSTSLRQPGSAFTVATPRHRRGETTTDRAAVAAGQRPHAASRPGCRSSVLGHPGGWCSTAD